MPPRFRSDEGQTTVNMTVESSSTAGRLGVFSLTREKRNGVGGVTGGVPPGRRIRYMRFSRRWAPCGTARFGTFGIRDTFDSKYQICKNKGLWAAAGGRLARAPDKPRAALRTHPLWFHPRYSCAHSGAWPRFLDDPRVDTLN